MSGWRAILSRGESVRICVDGVMTPLVAPDDCPRGFVASDGASVIRERREPASGCGLSLLGTDEEISISCGGATMRLNSREKRVEMTSADTAGGTVTLVLDAKDGATIRRS